MKLRDVTIEGKTVAINVEASGRFSAEWNGEAIEGPSLNALTLQLEKLIRKSQREAPVAVTVLGLVPVNAKSTWRMSGDGPYTEGDGYVHAVLRGKHSRQYDTWLLTDEAGQKFQVHPRLHNQNGTIITRRLSDVAVKNYLALCEERRQAVDRLNEYLKAVIVSPADVLTGTDKESEATK